MRWKPTMQQVRWLPLIMIAIGLLIPENIEWLSEIGSLVVVAAKTFIVNPVYIFLQIIFTVTMLTIVYYVRVHRSVKLYDPSVIPLLIMTIGNVALHIYVILTAG